MNMLTGDDLARPARDLPFKVIQELGNMLQYNSGQWETVAEELGYNYQEIKKFSTMATVSQNSTPGEQMLRDWIQKAHHGHTLFVLHCALSHADRTDCVEFLEAETYKQIVCMSLNVCIKHEDGQPTVHQRIRTRADASLLQSLQNVLLQPVIQNYTLLDPGVSWTGTQARSFKGRQLMLMKRNVPVSIEQDPTVDSSRIEFAIEETQFGVTYAHRVQTTTLSAVTKDLPVISSISDLPATSPSPMVCSVCGNSTLLGHRNVLDRSLSHVPALRRSAGAVMPDTHNDLKSSTECAYRPRAYSLQPLSEREKFSQSGSSQNRCASCKYLVNDLDLSLPHSDRNLAQMSVNIPTNHEKESNISKIMEDKSLSDILKLESRVEQVIMDITEGTRKRAVFTSNTGAAQMDSVPISGSSMSDEKISDLDGEKNFPSGEEEEYIPMSDISDELNTSCHYLENEFDDDIYRDPDRCSTDVNVATSVKCDMSGKGTDLSWRVRDIEEGYQKSRGDLLFETESAEYVDPSEKSSDGKSQDSVPSFPSTGFEVSRGCQSLVDSDSSYLEHAVNTVPEFLIRNHDNVVLEFRDDFNNSEYQFARSDSAGSDDSITKLKQKIHTEAKRCQDHSGVHRYLDLNQYCGDASVMAGSKFVVTSAISEMHRSGETSSGSQQLAGSFVSEVTSNRAESSVDCRRYSYESLQRAESCPVDVYYEQREQATETSAMVTIADVFSPVDEDFRLKDFETESIKSDPRDATQSNTKSECSGSPRETEDCQSLESISLSSSSSTDSISSMLAKRHTFPAVKDKNDAKRSKLEKCSGQTEDRMASCVKQAAGTSPALPPRRNLIRLNKDNSKASDTSLLLANQQIPDIVGPSCRIVIGGKTSRPQLDSHLADDKLFVHYNMALQGVPGWSPRETEYTVEKTMSSALSSDGNYIFWYIRERKNLVLSASCGGALVNYRIHTKVLNKKLHYYITLGKYFTDILHLIQHYRQNGVRSPLRGGRETAEFRIPLLCPVKVQYEKKSAVSV